MAKTDRIMTVDQIGEMLEECGVAPKAFWAAAGVDPSPMPRSAVDATLDDVTAETVTCDRCGEDGLRGEHPGEGRIVHGGGETRLGEHRDGLLCDDCADELMDVADTRERLSRAVAWVVPPRNQGQIVEVAYGWHEGRLYRQTLDRSDRSLVVEVCDDDVAAELSESWHPVNCAPDVDESAWTEAQS